MPRYLLEAYVADSTSAQREARAHATRVASLGDGILHVRTTVLPDDQLVLHVFEAPSGGALERAARRAGLGYERLLEAVEESDDPAVSTNGESPKRAPSTDR